jgi:poly-gamma-glutamate biosynthesis protein PgsC/CapC
VVIEAIFIGMLVGLVYYELFGAVAGGIVVPGYIALHLLQPGRILVTLVVAFLTLGVLRLLSQLVFIFGRRAFMAALVVGFLLRWGAETALLAVPETGVDVRVIGYIIPGLIAYEMSRQGVMATLRALAVVAVVTKLLLVLRYGT